MISKKPCMPFGLIREIPKENSCMASGLTKEILVVRFYRKNSVLTIAILHKKERKK
jgi:hypothetical protein